MTTTNLRTAIMPSLLAADMGRLEEACKASEEAGADGLHIDIMDGHFVPNLSMGPDVVKMARRHVKLQLNVHLMVTNPDLYAEVFVSAGADTLLFHIEAKSRPRDVLKAVRAKGARAGIVLNPETPAEAAFELLDEVDQVLCMTVHPGFGGQNFIEGVLPKIASLRKRAPQLDISVDGGINDETAALAAASGANIFLVGTSIFRAGNMTEALNKMRAGIQAAMKNA